jgi:rubrerythrin
LSPHSRRAFLGAGSAVALVGASLMREFVDAATGANPGDLQTLNAAIELENAGIKAYDDAAATKLLAPAVLSVALGFRADHVAHRDALAAAVRAGGATPSTKVAKIAYPALATQTDVLKFAKVVEEQAASTYLSVIPDLVDRTLAQVAASILGVETTHVALLAEALGLQKVYEHGFVT